MLHNVICNSYRTVELTQFVEGITYFTAFVTQSCQIGVILEYRVAFVILILVLTVLQTWKIDYDYGESHLRHSIGSRGRCCASML